MDSDDAAKDVLLHVPQELGWRLPRVARKWLLFPASFIAGTPNDFPQNAANRGPHEVVELDL
jgi:hypothetical protein